MIFFRKLYALYKYDRAIGHLFHTWLYLWDKRDDAGDRAAFNLVDKLVSKMMLQRERFYD